MFYTYFAHAGEAHNETSESISHWLSDSSTALLVWVAISALIIFVLPKVIKKLDKSSTMLVFAAANLIYGVYLYDKSPEIGAIALSLGFATTLLSVITGLKLDEPQTKGKNVRSKK